MVLSVIESDRTLSHVTLSENIVVIEGFCLTVSSYDGDKTVISQKIFLKVVILILKSNFYSCYKWHSYLALNNMTNVY